MINTFSLYAEPSSCTDFRSTPFMPFLPSLPRRLRQHRRMQKKHMPSITIEMPIKIAITPHGCTCSFSLTNSTFLSKNVCFVTAGSLVDPTAAAAPSADGSTGMPPNNEVQRDKQKSIICRLQIGNHSISGLDSTLRCVRRMVFVTKNMCLRSRRGGSIFRGCSDRCLSLSFPYTSIERHCYR